MFEDLDFETPAEPSNVNWRRWESMLNFIKSLKPRAISMGSWYELDDQKFPYDQETCERAGTVGQAAADCNTAGCFAGWTFLKNAKRKDILGEDVARSFATDYLRLNSDEADHAFTGLWTSTYISDIKKRDLVKYLTKALKNKNVLVTI